MGPDWPALTGCYSLLQQHRGSWTAAELSFHEVLLVCKCFLYPGRNYAERRGRRRIPDRKLNKSSTLLQVRPRPEAERRGNVALLLLQRSKEQEEQEAEKHPRWEGGGKTGILTNAQSTAILTRKGEKWKRWVLRLGNENRCISAPNILYPLIKPLSTSVHRGFLSKCSLIFCSFCKTIFLS